MPLETDTTIDILNGLLRGELSAAATYRQAERRFPGHRQRAELRRLGEEHWRAADALHEQVQRRGGRPSETAGAWGAFAALVEGTAKLFGARAALWALREGERQGIDDYESALDTPHLPPECHALIAGELLPRCREHVLAHNGLDARG
jgi:demethoxyubiquinone hydroxylase (CLK1/Coq7/Cat5 family)